MFRPIRAAIFALSFTTLSRAAFAEEGSRAPATVPELRAYAEGVKKSDPARYRVLRAELARLEAKQQTSNVLFYGGMGAGVAITVGGASLAPRKDCDKMPGNTAEELRAKAACLRHSSEVGLISLGVGAAVAVGSWIASEIVSPSREDVRRAVNQQQAKRRVRVDVGGDPKSKSVGAAMQLVF